MRAFHNDPAVKEKYLNRVRAHREADRLIQALTWDRANNRGCAIGCTLEAYNHSLYPIELGVPVTLAHLEDAIFEGLPAREAQSWPERFLTAIHVGADLSHVWARFALWLLETELKVYPSRVAALYRRQLVGDPPTNEEWLGAARAARAAGAAAAAAEAAREAGARATDFWLRAADKLIELLENAGRSNQNA